MGRLSRRTGFFSARPSASTGIQAINQILYLSVNLRWVSLEFTCDYADDSMSVSVSMVMAEKPATSGDSSVRT